MSWRIPATWAVCICLLRGPAVVLGAEDPPIVLVSQAASGSWYWVQADYLRWQLKDAPLDDPLVATGRLGHPATETLFGAAGLDFDAFPGARLSGGCLLNSGSGLALEASGFALGQRSVQFSTADAAGDTAIARPVIDAQTELETAELISFPGEFAGGVDLVASSQLWGAEANLTLGTSGFPIRWLAGFRYLDLDEGLFIDQRSSALADGVARFGHAAVPAGGSLTILDSFETDNKFYGGQLGGSTRLAWSFAWIDLIGKVALGSTHRRVRIDGSTALAGAPGPLPGGLLSLPTNMGEASGNSFAAIPEIELRLGCRLASRLSAHLGYSVLYWPHVVRPGDQIDRSVNLTQPPSSLAYNPLTGPARPAAIFRETDFFVHGLSLGLQLSF